MYVDVALKSFISKSALKLDFLALISFLFYCFPTHPFRLHVKSELFRAYRNLCCGKSNSSCAMTYAEWIPSIYRFAIYCIKCQTMFKGKQSSSFFLYALYSALQLFIHIRRNIRHILWAHAYIERKIDELWKTMQGLWKNSNLFNAPLDEIKNIWVLFNAFSYFMSIADLSIYKSLKPFESFKKKRGTTESDWT